MNRRHLARTRPIRTLLVVLTAALVALLGTAVTAVPASAAAGTGSGWVRLAHLSPDTPSVNVSLTSFSDSSTMLKLHDISYGDVSGYQKVPAGRYVATMTPAKGWASSAPSITQAVTVEKGHAYTVAAVGDNAHLRGTVLDDDLRTPAKGSAKVRLLQASISAPQTTVTAVGGPVLAKEAVFGSVTGYATIGAGVWTVQIAPTKGDAAAAQAKIVATPGSVDTIIVLDGANGQVTAKVVKDASAAPVMPKKGTGVETGLGGTATEFVGDAPAAPGARSSEVPADVAVVALILVGGLVVRRLAVGRGGSRSAR